VQQYRTARGRARASLATGLLLTRAVAVGSLAALVLYTALNSFYVFLAFLLQAGLKNSPFPAGLMITPLAVAYVAASFVAGRFGPRASPQGLVAGGTRLTPASGGAALTTCARSGLAGGWRLSAPSL